MPGDTTKRSYDLNGWSFERLADGSVRISASGMQTVVAADTWAILVASVSARGRDEHTVTLALGFHQLSAPPAG